MADKPTERQLKALRDVEAVSREGAGILNKGDCEECVDKDWLEPAGGGYRLTQAGQRILKEASR